MGQVLGQAGSDLGWCAELLAHHPLGGSFLALPGLQELLGNSLEGLQISGGLDGSAHALQLKLLTEAEGEGFRHGTHRE